MFQKFYILLIINYIKFIGNDYFYGFQFIMDKHIILIHGALRSKRQLNRLVFELKA